MTGQQKLSNLTTESKQTLKNKESLGDLWLYNRRSNLYIFGGDVRDREDEKRSNG